MVEAAKIKAAVCLELNTVHTISKDLLSYSFLLFSVRKLLVRKDSMTNASELENRVWSIDARSNMYSYEFTKEWGVDCVKGGKRERKQREIVKKNIFLLFVISVFVQQPRIR